MGSGMRSPASTQPPAHLEGETSILCAPQRDYLWSPSSSSFFSKSCKAGERRHQPKPGHSGGSCRGWGAGRDPITLLQLNSPFRLTLESGHWLGVSMLCTSAGAESCVLRERGKHMGPAGRGDLEQSQGPGKNRRRASWSHHRHPHYSLSARLPTSSILGSRVAIKSIILTGWQ